MYGRGTFIESPSKSADPVRSLRTDLSKHADRFRSADRRRSALRDCITEPSSASPLRPHSHCPLLCSMHHSLHPRRHGATKEGLAVRDGPSLTRTLPQVPPLLAPPLQKTVDTCQPLSTLYPQVKLVFSALSPSGRLRLLFERDRVPLRVLVRFTPCSRLRSVSRQPPLFRLPPRSAHAISRPHHAGSELLRPMASLTGSGTRSIGDEDIIGAQGSHPQDSPGRANRGDPVRR